MKRWGGEIKRSLSGEQETDHIIREEDSFRGVGGDMAGAFGRDQMEVVLERQLRF